MSKNPMIEFNERAEALRTFFGRLEALHTKWSRATAIESEKPAPALPLTDPLAGLETAVKAFKEELEEEQRKRKSRLEWFQSFTVGGSDDK